MDTRELGALGEDLACEYLVKNGFNILGRNYRITLGEIDIIARKKRPLFSRKAIHFVEVKTLAAAGEGFAPEDHVNYQKQQKLIKLSQIWLQKNRFSPTYPHQIDVIAVTVNPINQKTKLTYFPNAVPES